MNSFFWYVLSKNISISFFSIQNQKVIPLKDTYVHEQWAHSSMCTSISLTGGMVTNHSDEFIVHIQFIHRIIVWGALAKNCKAFLSLSEK